MLASNLEENKCEEVFLCVFEGEKKGREREHERVRALELRPEKM